MVKECKEGSGEVRALCKEGNLHDSSNVLEHGVSVDCLSPGKKKSVLRQSRTDRYPGYGFWRNLEFKSEFFKEKTTLTPLLTPLSMRKSSLAGTVI